MKIIITEVHPDSVWYLNKIFKDDVDITDGTVFEVVKGTLTNGACAGWSSAELTSGEEGMYEVVCTTFKYKEVQ